MYNAENIIDFFNNMLNLVNTFFHHATLNKMIYTIIFHAHDICKTCNITALVDK